MSDVVRMRVVCRLNAAVTRSAPSTHGKNQLRPVPSKIARYVEIGFLPVVTKTTRPPIANASTVVMSAVTNPPARCMAANR